MTQEGIAFVISAPSGTGKTTVLRTLKKKLPELRFSVSHTTRPPRADEKDGEDYHFVSESRFCEMIDGHQFLEWAKILNRYYGTTHQSIRELTEKGKDIVLELDVQGVGTLRKARFPGVFIFILPPSLKELRARLEKRGTEPNDKIEARVEMGKGEIRKSEWYDYLLTNYQVEDTVDQIIAIMKAEKCRRERYKPTSPDLEPLFASQVKN